MNKFEQIVLGAFISSSMILGGTILSKVSGNQIAITENSVYTATIMRDITEIKIDMGDYDTRIDDNTRTLAEMKYKLAAHIDAMQTKHILPPERK